MKLREIKMARKIIAVFIVLLAIGTGCAGVWLALNHLEAEPVLLEVPEAARTQALNMMDALCAGDYGAVEQVLYGQPELGMDRQPEDFVGQLFFAAYAESLRYELLRDCYATANGVALDVRVTAWDAMGLLPQLRQQAQLLLEQRVAEAEDVSQIYDENGEYREELVMEVLHTSAETVLKTEKSSISIDLTLECVFENGQWWIVPEDALLDVIGCRLGR